MSATRRRKRGWNQERGLEKWKHNVRSTHSAGREEKDNAVDKTEEERSGEETREAKQGAAGAQSKESRHTKTQLQHRDRNAQSLFLVCFPWMDVLVDFPWMVAFPLAWNFLYGLHVNPVGVFSQRRNWKVFIERVLAPPSSSCFPASGVCVCVCLCVLRGVLGRCVFGESIAITHLLDDWALWGKSGRRQGSREQTRHCSNQHLGVVDGTIVVTGK